MKEKNYEEIYQFLLKCGNEHDPYQFCNMIVKELQKFVFYDQARVIFLAEKENEKVNLCDWTNEETKSKNMDFEEAYVRPLQLKYCLGIGLSDVQNCIRAIISLDRVKDKKFTEEEVAFIRKIRPLLDNLFINLLVDRAKGFSQKEFVMSHVSLTRREEEIVKLLYHGASPAAISERLCISINTAYKHIANVYKKWV